MEMGKNNCTSQLPFIAKKEPPMKILKGVMLIDSKGFMVVKT